jgi:hypothetical protein
VNNTVKIVLKEVCELSLMNDIQKMEELDFNDIIYEVLSTEQINKLVKKIDLLPFEYKNIFFFRYYFNSTPSETDKILKIENSKNKLRYIQKMLSCFMDLGNSWIDDNSLKKACEIVLIEDAKNYDNIEILHQPNYSKNFRRKLKHIKIRQVPNKKFMLTAKRVAIIILVCILSFTTVLAVNVEAREKMFDWIIEVFEKFSIFTPQDIDKHNNLAEPISLKVNYIPNGFKLEDTQEFKRMLVYNYSSDNNQELIIKLFASDRKGKSYYDTENTEIEEFIFKESQAFTWQTDKMTYLIWYQDDIECHISGNLSKDEIIKVAENISK